MHTLRNVLTMALMLVAGVLFALIVPGTNAQECALGTAVQYKGNWYCSPVDSISYRNFPGTGHYNRVTHMDVETGACETEKYVYSGSLSPLNEEVGFHTQLETFKLQLTSELLACDPRTGAYMAETVCCLRPEVCIREWWQEAWRSGPTSS